MAAGIENIAHPPANYMVSPPLPALYHQYTFDPPPPTQFGNKHNGGQFAGDDMMYYNSMCKYHDKCL